MIIKLVALGEPKAQKRHRSTRVGSTRVGGFTRQYDPSAKDKADFLSIVQQNAPDKPIDVPIHLTVQFLFSRPKSHFKTGKNAHILKNNAPIWHTSKPDIDNLYKLISDALNKVYWKDDSLIVAVEAMKRYSSKPRIEIEITTL